MIYDSGLQELINELQVQENDFQSISSIDPIVLCASDDNYVKPLAVTLHSAASSLKRGNHLNVILMDGGISEANWIGLRETLLGLPITVHVIRPQRTEVSDLGISHHITHTAYFRLLAARLLPDSIDKVIYLDSDVLVMDDLTELWEMEIGNDYCLAAVDIACPFVDAYQAIGKNDEFKKAIPYLAAITPIPNWKQLKLDGAAPYFNSGVMVLNLKRWRRESIDQQLLACLRENTNHVWCWDQYALNVVFAGAWRPLPPRWNQGAHVFEYPDETFSPISTAEFVSMRDRPALIHYTTEFKPWKYHPSHPLRETFFERLDETAWAGWRPDKPDFSLRSWWDSLAVNWIRKSVIGYRKFRPFFRP